MLGKKENLLGLDIGSHSAKIVQLDVKGTALKLSNFGLVPLPREAFKEGRVSKPEIIAGTIQQLATHLRIKEKQAAASIPGYEVMIKKIDLPMMTEEELDSKMQAELGQYIPYRIDEVDVDYQIMDIARDRLNFMEVLLVAAKKESVNDYVNLVRLAGFEPRVMDVDFFALSNAFEATYGFGQETIALVDIGATKAIMSIITRGVPLFTRGISIGGGQVTERIRDQFRVSEDEAERIKLGEVVRELPAHDLQNIFVSVVRSWVNECKRAIDFHYSNFPDQKIERIYLSGGSCRIEGLDRVFRESLDAEVEIFNPFARIEHDPKDFDPAYVDYMGPQMAIALGLALRKTKKK